MRGGKEHARQTQSVIPDEATRAPESAPTASTSGPSTATTSTSNTQLTGPDVQSRSPAETPPETNSGSYQDVLVECNSLVERYRKGEVSKAQTMVQNRCLVVHGARRWWSGEVLGPKRFIVVWAF